VLRDGRGHPGGGIPPKIIPALEKGGFMAAMIAKGRMTPWLKEVPVRVALNPRAALIGAAHLLAGPEAGPWR
jgi:glucokinase